MSVVWGRSGRSVVQGSDVLLPLIELDSQSFSPTASVAGCLLGAPTPMWDKNRKRQEKNLKTVMTVWHVSHW